MNKSTTSQRCKMANISLSDVISTLVTSRLVSLFTIDLACPRRRGVHRLRIFHVLKYSPNISHAFCINHSSLTVGRDNLVIILYGQFFCITFISVSTPKGTLALKMLSTEKQVIINCVRQSKYKISLLLTVEINSVIQNKCLSN